MLSPITALFLALACHTVLCAPGIQRSLSIEEEYMEKNMDEKEPKLNFKWIRKNGIKLAELLTGAAGSIPHVGALVSTVLKAPFLAIPEADKLDGIRTEMNALNTRLDNFYEELKWASYDLQGVLNNIDHAWLKYEEMAKDQKALENTFFPFYRQYVDSVLVLHNLLVSKPERNTQTLADVLAKRFSCHEKDVEELFLYAKELICKGNEMDEKYYTFMKLNYDLRKKRSEQILKDSNLAFFTTHQRCVSNRELYIKRDVLERINDNKLHEDIAKNIGTFLREKYDRYDWLVFAFTTHFSKTMARFMKRHLFSGFTEIERGTVTVAVASQVRGSYDKTEDIKKKLIPKKDKPETIPCSSVESKLQELDLMNDITAVHVYKKPNTAPTPNAKEDERLEESFLSATNNYDKYTYTGECERINGVSDGQYTILIKSDEERDEIKEREKRERGEERGEEKEGKHLCKTLQCKNNGKCVIEPRTKTPMCQCDSQYYGRECEHKIDCTNIASWTVGIWFPKLGREVLYAKS